jgi:eukaryotic-like serine/threonine-protein kinase
MGSHPTTRELADLESGRLPARERERIATHLHRCEGCQGEVNRLRELLKATVPDEGLANTHRPSGLRLAPGIAVGSQIGRYVVKRRLGQGAMGEVFAAYDPRLDRQVAVKVLRHDVLAVENQPLRKRLEREAQALAQLSHPNVVAVHDLGDFGDSLFIAMDLVEGETLTDWLRVARSSSEVQRMFLQAGAGLAAAHRAGLVHRDFKPDNVLVGADGVVRVSDFGVSRRVDVEPRSDEESLSGAGSLVGSPAYMSPEQFDGAPADAQSDQFSFCVALFEALVGRLPFEAASLRDLRDLVRRGGAAFPDDSSVPRWLQSLVLRGLSTRQEGRFPSMDELLVVLRGPHRFSRQLLGALIAIAVLATIVGALGARELERLRTDPCNRVDERTTNAWSPALQQRLEAGVLATKVPWAADSARHLQTVFDGFIAQWRTGYRAICAEVAHSSGPERTLALSKQACLDARLESFGRFRAAYETAEASMLREGTRAMEAALADELCSGVETRLELPDDPAKRTAFLRLRDQSLELATDVRLSRGGDLRPRLEACREEAEALGFKGIAASVRHQEGLSSAERAPLETVLTIFEDAALRAEVARDDFVVFRARLELARLLAQKVDVKRARALMPAVRAASERLGLDPDSLPEVIQAEALVLLMEGRRPEAIERQRAAIAALGDHVDAAPWDVLSTMQSQVGQFDASLESIAKAKALALAALGAQHPGYGAVLLSEAAQLNRAHRIEESFKVTEQALAIFEKDPDTRGFAMALYNHAVVLRNLKRRDEALPMMMRAIALFEALGEVPRLATMLSGAAETLQQAGRLDEALVASQKALALAERASGANSIQLARPLAIHGALLEELQRYGEAAQALERSLELQTGPTANPVLRDFTRYDLARARWHDRSTRAAAVEEAKSVRAALMARGDRFKEEVVEVDQWLARHPPR